MFEFKNEEELEKDEQISYLQEELRKYKSKANLIKQVNSIVNRSAVSDDLYKTLFIYIVEMMDEMNKQNNIPVHFIKEYMENLLEDVQVEIFLGENLYSKAYNNEVSDKSEMKGEELHSLYNLSTSGILNIEKILESVEFKSDLVEISDIKLNNMGLSNYMGGAVWVMEPLLQITPGFIVFLLNKQKYLTPIEKELISVLVKVLLPVIYSKILMKRVAEEAVAATRSALIDALTKMPNRKSFNEDYLDNVRVGTDVYYVMFLDLCKLKLINDTYGHDVADTVLIQLGKELSKFAEFFKGKAYRLGGDEFTALIPKNVEPEVLKIETQKFQDNWKQLKFSSSTEEFTSNVAIGVYRNNFSESTKANVVKRADELMYISKNDRKNYNIAYNF